MKGQEARKARTVNVNLQGLEVFCEVVRLQSFSRGGESCGISQSAASQVVAHLESQLGFKLINRKRRPLAPTPEGRHYYQGCRELLDRHRSLLDRARRRQETVTGTVRVASIYSVGLHTLSRYIQKFMREFRGSTVHLEYLHPDKVIAAVLGEEADLGVISYPSPQRQLVVIPWLQEEMVLACPAGHRLVSRERIGLEELDGEKFVAFDGDLRIRREIDRALRNRHVHVDIVSAFDNIETIKQALEISAAVSVLPRPSIQREVERGTLREVPLKEVELVRPVGIIHRRSGKLTRTAEEFVATLLDRPASAVSLETV